MEKKEFVERNDKKLTCLMGSRIACTRSYSSNESPSCPTTMTSTTMSSRNLLVDLRSTRKQQICRCSASRWRCQQRNCCCRCYCWNIVCQENAVPLDWCCTKLLRRPPGPHGDTTLHPGHQSHNLSLFLSFFLLQKPLPEFQHNVREIGQFID